MKLLYGDTAARLVSERIAAPVTTMTALKAIPGSRQVDGMYCHVLADDTIWQFDATSALTGDDLLVATPADASLGRWLRAPGACKIVIPFTFATADAAILLTMPTGAEFHLQEVYREVTADFTGGAASTIGLSSSNKASLTTKGDLLGGAVGDALAALTAAGAPNFGTIGTLFATLAQRRVFWKAAETIRHDRITSAFTAGTGNVVLLGNLMKNLGA
jgi:hypothetical protein